MPANAGIQIITKLDARFRGHDGSRGIEARERERSPMQNHQRYSHEPPMWAVATLCSLLIAIGLLLLAGAYYWSQLAHDSPAFVKWLLGAVGLVLILGGARPGNWQPWQRFYADSEGISFTSQCPAAKDTKWLHVPWNRVGTIKKARFVNRSYGPTIELKLGEDEIAQFFRYMQLANKLSGRPKRDEEYFTVGYSNNLFQRTDTVVKVQNRLKANYT